MKIIGILDYSSLKARTREKFCTDPRATGFRLVNPFPSPSIGRGVYQRGRKDFGCQVDG